MFDELSSRLYVLLFLHFVVTTFHATGQSKVYHEIFTSRDGLAIDDIKGFAQDHLGYLWIAGANLDSRDIVGKTGAVHLQRFDGKNFHNVRTNLSSGYGDINKITAYSDSKLIVHHRINDTDYKLSLLDTSTFENSDIAAPAIGNISHVQWVDGSLHALNVVGSTVEVHTLNDDMQFKRKFSFENSVKAFETDARTIFMCHNGRYIFSDDNFPILITDKNGNLLKRFSYDGYNRARDHLSGKMWIENAFVTHGRFYAFMRDYHELFVLNEETLDFEPLSYNGFKGKVDVTTFVDEAGQVLIAYDKDNTLHLATINESNDIVSLYSNPYDVQSGLQIWSRNIKDQVWVSTGKDLHYYKFPNEQFESFLTDKQLRSIKHLGNQEFMVATELNGWYRYNHQDKTIKPFQVFENDTPFLLSSSRNIFIDNDTLWSNSIGSIIAIHKENGGSRSYNYFPAQCLERLDDSTFIYGTKYLNLMKFNKVLKKHTPLVKTDSLNIFDLAIDPQKEWVVNATQNGIFTYNLKNGRSYLSKTSLSDPFFLTADYHESYGFLLGTRDGRVIKYDPVTDAATYIYNDDLKAGIATITPYNEDLWINTFNGLVQFTPETGRAQRYSVKDGLSHNEGNRYSAALTDNGILLGSLLGLNHFVPEELINQQSQDSLQLLRIRKFDSDLNKFVEFYDQSAFAKVEPIILPVENKTLELNFSLTGLDILRNESYEYKLDNEEWIDLKDEKNLQFLNLAAGTYTLNLRAKDFSGSVMGKPLTFSIISQDFFYNQWWFYVVLAAITALFVAWWLKIQRTKGAMQVQFSQDLIQNQEEERSRIAKELHDSIGQQLTLIKQTAQNENLEYIAGLTHMTLEEVRSISRNIYPASLQRLGFKVSVEYLLEDVDNQTNMFIDVEIDEVDHFMDQKTTLNLYRFVQEAISNVIKHARSKTLQVKITALKNDIGIYIMDNGKGFVIDKEGMNNSLGFKTLKERINIVKGTLEIKTTLGKGTELIATIPKINE
jgi:signal transduction histidine kinase/ribosomal protein L33